MKEFVIKDFNWLFSSLQDLLIVCNIQILNNRYFLQEYQNIELLVFFLQNSTVWMFEKEIHLANVNFDLFFDPLVTDLY